MISIIIDIHKKIVVSTTFIFFSILAILAIASAVVTVSSRNPLVSALSLIFHFFMLSGLYLTLQAQFVAVIQVLVYAGAIMVLVIFVIMLLNLKDEEKLKEIFSFRKLLGVLFGGALIVMFAIIFFTIAPDADKLAESSELNGTVENIGDVLFSQYLLPFEAVSILLIVAIVGAVILAKRKLR